MERNSQQSGRLDKDHVVRKGIDRRGGREQLGDGGGGGWESGQSEKNPALLRATQREGSGCREIQDLEHKVSVRTVSNRETHNFHRSDAVRAISLPPSAINFYNSGLVEW